MHDKQVSVEIGLKYVLVYHKCLSVHSAVNVFTFITKKQKYEITYNDYLTVRKALQLNGFHLKYDSFSLNCK